MQTAVKTQEFGIRSTQVPNTEKSKKLSKAGQWMRDNPKGIVEVRDWRAVNK